MSDVKKIMQVDKPLARKVKAETKALGEPGHELAENVEHGITKYISRKKSSLLK